MHNNIKMVYQLNISICTTKSYLLLITGLIIILLNVTCNGQRTSSVMYPSETNNNTLHIGALFPVHNFTVITDEHGEETHRCDRMTNVDGLMALEAFLFTLEEINRSDKILQGITLGGIAMDSCNSPLIARKMSLTYIKGNLASQLKDHHDDFTCSNAETPTYRSGEYDKVVGVIGGQRSTVSVEMAHILKLFKIPQISYLSTSVSLSSNQDFPYFLRTVPSDDKQAEVILKILKSMGWLYVSLVYSKDIYGVNGKKELVSQSGKYGVCFAEPIHELSYQDNDEKYARVAEMLLRNTQAGVVVLFAEKTVATLLLEKISVKLLHNDSKFRKPIFIGSDGWTLSKIKKDIERIVENTISVQPIHQRLPGFEDYFLNLTPETNTRNIWFNDFWERQFDCSFTDSNEDRKCDNKSRLKSSSFSWEFDWLHFLRDAVYAYAHAIDSMWSKHCGGKRGICSEMTHDGHIHGRDLLWALKNVSFSDVSGKQFTFDNNRSGSPRYTLLQYQHHENLNFSWNAIENYSEDTLPTFTQNLQWHHHLGSPTSECGPPCVNQIKKKISETDECCWTCDDCERNQIFISTSNTCSTCNKCQTPAPNGTVCVDKEVIQLKYRNHWVITATFFSSIGIIISILVGIIFWMHIDTPVIKAASRELSFILLTGIILCFCMTFLIMLPPTPASCGSIRFFIGFSYTLCYAAILTKTNRIARLFNSPSKVLKARFTSPESQMIIVFGLVGIEVAINLAWLLSFPPAVTKLCPIGEDHQIRTCEGIRGHYYLVGLVYPLILVFLCTIYAIKTRKCPGGFNEARYIAFTNYSTCIIWVVFVPLYLTKVPSDEARIVSLAMSLSLGGFVQLACLFLPKVHLVLFKPEKNTRDAVMSQQNAAGGSRGSNNGRRGAGGTLGLHEGTRGQSLPPPDIKLYPYNVVSAAQSTQNTTLGRNNIAPVDDNPQLTGDYNNSALNLNIHQQNLLHRPESQQNHLHRAESQQNHLHRPESQQSNNSRPTSRIGEDPNSTSRVSTYGPGQQKVTLIKKDDNQIDEDVVMDGNVNDAYATAQINN